MFLFNVFFSIVVYLVVINKYQLEQLQIIRLTQIYALTALSFLYIAILAEPFCRIFKRFPFHEEYLKSRNTIWLSVFYFGLLHACLAFFGQLGGFEGLGFLNQKYLIAITLSFTALIILFFLSMRSLDFLRERLKFLKWKVIPKLLYIAGVLVLIHALMLGTHFQDIFGFVPQLVFAGLMFLLVLEGLRIDAWAGKRFSNYPNLGYASVLSLGIIIAGIFYFFLPMRGENGFTFGIHSQHIQIAKNAQIENLPNSNAVSNSKMPGLQGDRTRRYTVSFNNPEDVKPNQDATLSFQVYDASSGNKVRLFNKLNDKIVHFIIVDSELKYFNHIHPEQIENEFKIITQFPKDGRYHLYLDFQPVGAIEQQFAFTLDVGIVENPTVSQLKPDTKMTKIFGDYEVSLEYPKPLKSSQLSIGEQLLTYTIKDAKTKKPITTLKPYLAAFGHVVMINDKTYDYIHVHPNDLRIPKPDQNGGPTVEFMPLGLYGSIKPGVYRVFAQFNPDNKLFMSDFTIEIK